MYGHTSERNFKNPHHILFHIMAAFAVAAPHLHAFLPRTEWTAKLCIVTRVSWLLPFQSQVNSRSGSFPLPHSAQAPCQSGSQPETTHRAGLLVFHKVCCRTLCGFSVLILELGCLVNLRSRGPSNLRNRPPYPGGIIICYPEYLSSYVQIGHKRYTEGDKEKASILGTRRIIFVLTCDVVLCSLGEKRPLSSFVVLTKNNLGVWVAHQTSGARREVR